MYILMKMTLVKNVFFTYEEAEKKRIERFGQ